MPSIPIYQIWPILATFSSLRQVWQLPCWYWDIHGHKNLIRMLHERTKHIQILTSVVNTMGYDDIIFLLFICTRLRTHIYMVLPDARIQDFYCPWQSLCECLAAAVLFLAHPLLSDFDSSCPTWSKKSCPDASTSPGGGDHMRLQ